MLARIPRPARVAITVALVAALIAATYAVASRPDDGTPPAALPGSTTSSRPPETTAAGRPSTSAADGEPIDTSGVLVDLGARGQVMDGFGVSARPFDDAHMLGKAGRRVPPDEQRAVLQSLYDDLGLTRMRAVLDPGLEPVNDNADPRELDATKLDYAGQNSDAHVALALAAEEVGLRTFWAAPVKVEPWMPAQDAEEAAESALALLERWRSLGLEPAFYSPLNEPSVRGARSTEWYVDMVKVLGARLRGAGLRTKLVIPDDVNPTKSLRTAERVLADPEARQYVGALAYHVYGGDPEDRRRMGDLGREYGLPVWMAEYSSKDYDTWSGAIEWATSMSGFITEDNVSAVDYLWGYFSVEDGGHTLIQLQFRGTQFTGTDARPPYAVVGQFSRFVPPGAVRVDAAAPGPVVASAFLAPDGNLVIVLINPSGESIDVPVAVQGGTLSGPVSVTRSSDREQLEDLAALPVTDEGFHAELPPMSISTYVVPLAA